jgi:hypothetical protein
MGFFIKESENKEYRIYEKKYLNWFLFLIGIISINYFARYHIPLFRDMNKALYYTLMILVTIMIFLGLSRGDIVRLYKDVWSSREVINDTTKFGRLITKVKK